MRTKIKIISNRNKQTFESAIEEFLLDKLLGGIKFMKKGNTFTAIITYSEDIHGFNYDEKGGKI